MKPVTPAVVAAGFFLLLTTASNAQDRIEQNNDRIWSGVYITAQAERGKAAFVKNCSNCHSSTLDGTVRAPALRGDRFMADWINTNVYTLFTKLRDTMPATYPETVADDVKLDILTYLLQANSFPGGSTELKLDEKDLANIQIVKKGMHEIPNFALVELTGCLRQGPGNSWTLINASDPVVTKEETTTQTTTDPQPGPLGTQTYLLVSVTAFNPASHQGQKMEARGLLYREPKESRINLTSLQTVAPECN
jgi:mono/diheme cytochrome c family protein